MERRFDVVLVHGTLHFISADRRVEALTRMQRAIRPGGRLVLLFNTSRPVAAEIIQENRADLGVWCSPSLSGSMCSCPTRKR